MFIKLTPAVNFINNLRTNFSYEMSFRQLFSRYMYVKKTTFVRKIRMLMLMKLTAGANFINILSSRYLYESKLSSFSLITFKFVILAPKFYTKNSHVKR